MQLRDMPWRQAMIQVLRDAGTPMHYAEIAQSIIDNGYRTNVGATPAATVAANFSESIRGDTNTPFVKVDRGMYRLRTPGDQTPPIAGAADDVAADAAEMGLINAFGMFWSRSGVVWKPTKTKLLGQQQSGSRSVDFTAQAGVYVLYDANRPIYVGRVTELRLGARLYDHTRDRLTGRWDRFSWFGVRGVRDDGSLTPAPGAGIAVDSLIATMEALLIEGLEPPQNRRQGDGFNAMEFIQLVDPDIERSRQKELLEKLSRGSGLT